jgi:hypothetical protein
MAWSQSTALHDVTPRRARSPRPTPQVQTPRQPSTCRSMCRSTVVPARSLGATCFASMGRSAAVPAPCRPTNRAPAYTPHVAAAPFAPYPGHAAAHAWVSLDLVPKPSPQQPCAWASSHGHRAVGVRHECHLVNSTPACFPSPTRAVFHFTRTPVAPARACWSTQAASSPEGSLPRPPPNSRCRTLLPARLPGQPTTSAHPLDPSEAARATHWPVPSLSSPEFEHPRPRHHRTAAAARR